MSSSAASVETAEGTCPECGGEAMVFLNTAGGDRGHIYCQEEDDCGWIHRHFAGVSEFVGGEE